MIKRVLKKWLPHPKNFHLKGSLHWLNHWLHDHNLWHINRHKVAGGVALGLFINFIPLPLQILWAAILALILRVNLPLAIVMTWINNPFTFIPINLMIYQVGSWLLGDNHAINIANLPAFEWRFESLKTFGTTFVAWFSALGKAYLVGLPIVCLVTSISGYLLVSISWKLAIQYRWRYRQRTKKACCEASSRVNSNK